jgi:hypothetical protein
VIPTMSAASRPLNPSGMARAPLLVRLRVVGPEVRRR